MSVNSEIKYLKDYQAPDFSIDKIDLTFNIFEDHTQVHSRMLLSKVEQSNATSLSLAGSAKLLQVSLDGEVLAETDYVLADDVLTLNNVPASCVLEIDTYLEPEKNTSLMGLYGSSGNLYTQCEPEGFRKITYYLDRPDAMSKFTTTIIADQKKYPILLSNGNKIGSGMVDKDRHWVKWVDPYRKPAYLFALVAGKLVAKKDTYTTGSGREVTLEIWTIKEDQDKVDFAMGAVKRSMLWDEQRFGLEYDLDIYMIVAVSDFNMGAMENKGLNIFNTSAVLTRQDISTDADFERVEAIIAHEYFHNWTGNRVTCRDWFQLSLKEGLTVFRDQEFTSDLHSRGVKRIDDVKRLRSLQFPEDASPTAHSIRPDSYIEMNNFYTMTVYEKGAEVVRMYHTLLKEEGFQKGMKLYFKRHDGQAVTCDDFRLAMADANGVDLEQFGLWYSTAGTPVLHVSHAYDETAKTYTLNIKQHCPDTQGQTNKPALHIPFAFALVGSNGQDLALQLKGESDFTHGTRVLSVTEFEQSFVFENVEGPVIPSLLRGFSAPVRVVYDYSSAELAFLMKHDSDEFARWEAGQAFSEQLLRSGMQKIQQNEAFEVPSAYVDAMCAVLTHDSLDAAFKALMLTMPSETEVLELFELVDPSQIHAVRESILNQLANQLAPQWQATLDACHRDVYQVEDLGLRALKNVALSMLVRLKEQKTLSFAYHQVEQADNMTDQWSAFVALRDIDCAERLAAETYFVNKWKHDALVMDKYFSWVASTQLDNALELCQNALSHAEFSIKNPNKVRALLGTFARNLKAFHKADGSGYHFIADHIKGLDAINPQVASGLAKMFGRRQKVDLTRQALMKSELESILSLEGLSSNVYEIVSKNLSA